MYKQLIPWTIHTENYLHVTLELPRKESFCTVLKFSMASCLQENRTGRSSQPCPTIWLTHTFFIKISLGSHLFGKPSWWITERVQYQFLSNWFRNLKPFTPWSGHPKAPRRLCRKNSVPPSRPVQPTPDFHVSCWRASLVLPVTWVAYMA